MSYGKKVIFDWCALLTIQFILMSIVCEQFVVIKGKKMQTDSILWKCIRISTD